MTTPNWALTPMSLTNKLSLINITNKHDNEAVISKKRKFSDSRLEAVLKYSQLKLPAQQFLTYLENYGANFLVECCRY